MFQNDFNFESESFQTSNTKCFHKEIGPLTYFFMRPLKEDE